LYSVLQNNNLLSCRQCQKLEDGRMFKILMLFANDMLVSFLLRSFTCCVLHTQKNKERGKKRPQKEVCNSSSRMGAIYSLIVRKEEMLMEQSKRECGGCGFVVRKERDEDIKLAVVPVFSLCTKVYVSSLHVMIILLLCLGIL